MYLVLAVPDTEVIKFRLIKFSCVRSKVSSFCWSLVFCVCKIRGAPVYLEGEEKAGTLLVKWKFLIGLQVDNLYSYFLKYPSPKNKACFIVIEDAQRNCSSLSIPICIG